MTRNTPGGLAWIKLSQRNDGSEILNGHVVRTVRAYGDGMWIVEPTQSFTVTRPTEMKGGTLARPGCRVDAAGIHDDCLIPLKNPGDSERDESRVYLPPVPIVRKNAIGST